MSHARRLGKRLHKTKPKRIIVMRKMNGKSQFGALWHFDDEERGDIYFSIAHQGESSDGDKEFSNVERI
jgi:hypothetical protein